MRIYFTRHGESQANILRQISNRGLVHPLTRIGRESRRLRWPIGSGIAPSPGSTPARMLRAIETSVIVANRLGVEYEVTDALAGIRLRHRRRKVR